MAVDWNQLAESLGRSLVSVGKGYSNALVQVEQAKTERERAVFAAALNIYQSRMQKTLAEIQQATEMKRIEAEERIAERGAQSAETVATTQAGAQRDVATTQADATRDVATTQADAQKAITDTETQSAERIASDANKTALEKQRIANAGALATVTQQGINALKIAEAQGESREAVAETEADIKRFMTENPESVVLLESVFSQIDAMEVDDATKLQMKKDVLKRVYPEKIAASRRSTSDFASSQAVREKYPVYVQSVDADGKPEVNADGTPKMEMNPNRQPFDRLSVDMGKDKRQNFFYTLDGALAGRSFRQIPLPQKIDISRYLARVASGEAPGGDMVNRFLFSQSILNGGLPGLRAQWEKIKDKTGRWTKTAEGVMRWAGTTTDPDVMAFQATLAKIVNDVIRLQSGAEVREQEMTRFLEMLPAIGNDAEVNEELFDALESGIKAFYGTFYTSALGNDWGQIAAKDAFENPREVYENVQQAETAETDTTPPTPPAQTPPIPPTPAAPEDAAVRPDDYFHTGADGDEGNVDAEIRLMLDVDGYTREQTEAQLKEWYPDLPDAKLNELLDKYYPGGE